MDRKVTRRSVAPARSKEALNVPDTKHVPTPAKTPKPVVPASKVGGVRAPHKMPNIMGCVKPKTQVLDETEKMIDIKYNDYLRTLLTVSYIDDIRERNRQKVICDAELLEIKLLEMEDQISELDSYLRRKQFLDEEKHELEQRIETYKSLFGNETIKHIDDCIEFIKNDLNNLKINNFLIPDNKEDCEAVVAKMDEICKTLPKLPEIKEKLAVLSELQRTVIELSDTSKRRKTTKQTCNRKIDVAEELVYHNLYLKQNLMGNKT